MDFERSFCLIEVHSTEGADILYRSIVDVEKMESEVFVKEDDWASEFKNSEIYENFFHASIHPSRQSAMDWFAVAKKLKYEDRELRYVAKSFDKMDFLLRTNFRKNKSLFEDCGARISELLGNINSVLRNLGRDAISRADLWRSHPETSRGEIYASWKQELEVGMDSISVISPTVQSCDTDDLLDFSGDFYEFLFEDTFLDIEDSIRTATECIFSFEEGAVNGAADFLPVIPEELAAVISDLDFMETTLEYQESLIRKLSEIRSVVERRQLDNRGEYSRNVPVAFWVYLTYSESDELLYVGKTGSLFHRFRDHSLGSRWFPLMDRMVAVPFYSDSEALINEAKLIKKLRPRFNIVHNSD